MKQSTLAAAFSSIVHVFGALTCASCWAIFGPALALLFGSSVSAYFDATLRPYAPLAIVVSAIGLTYSIVQLVRKREDAAKLPYRMAAAFTTLSAIGWVASAAFVTLTVVKG